MKRLITTLALAATMVLATASVGLAAKPAGPTCFGLDTGHGAFANHGEHVKADYVKGETKLPGGPGAKGHLLVGIAPGASFCNSNSNSPGFHFPAE